jgi:hypothetical protein
MSHNEKPKEDKSGDLGGHGNLVSTANPFARVIFIKVLNTRPVYHQVTNTKQVVTTKIWGCSTH